MRRQRKLRLLAITTILCFKIATAVPVITTTQISTNTENTEAINTKNNRQTLVRKLIVLPENSSHAEIETNKTNSKTISAKQHAKSIEVKELPLSPSQEGHYAEEAKKIIDKITNDELKIRCQHLSRILTASNTNFSQSHHRYVTRKPEENTRSEMIRRPVYIHNKPTYVQSVKSANNKSSSGFYITTQASSTTHRPRQTTTTTKTTATPKSHQTTNNIKYIRLEPVILQKTILNDGRILYYWHRSLPTAVEYPSQNFVTEKGTEEPITTTTEYTSYLNFRNLLPFYGSSSNKEETTTTSPTTASTVDKNVVSRLYNQQLKFVVPLPYPNPQIPLTRKPWEFDRFAYYPKEMQPNMVQMQMPYQPTFHMIRSIAIPGAQYQREQAEKSE